MAYEPCIGGTITINGAPGKVTGGGFNCESNRDEVTNLAGGGYYESCRTYKKATATVDFVYDNAAPPEFEEGDEIDLVLTSPSGIGLSGRFGVESMNFPILDPSKAVRFTCAMTSEGAYTRVYGGGP